jgi:hypothetical protein
LCLPQGFALIALVRDVAPAEHGPRFVLRDAHRNCLGNLSAYHVANRGATEIVKALSGVLQCIPLPPQQAAAFVGTVHKVNDLLRF